VSIPGLGSNAAEGTDATEGICQIFLGPVGQAPKELSASSSEGEPDDKPVKAHVASVNAAGYEKLPYPIIIDSGAAESVMPPGWCQAAELVKGPHFGKTYSAANGQEMTNSGEKVVTMVTRDSVWKNILFQECEVTRAFASVYRICEAGHRVVFNPSWHSHGSYIASLDGDGYATGENTWLAAKDGVFVLAAKVAPKQHQLHPGFARRGRLPDP